jgi:hypothetical protein
MSTEVSLRELIVLATAMLMLVAIIAAPTAADAATYQPHTHRSAAHHHRIAAPAFGFAPERVPDSGYDWGNPDRGHRTRKNAAEDLVKVKL